MDLRVKRSELASALRMVSGAVNATTHQPLYRCVKLSGDDDTAQVFATDLEVALEVSLPAQVDTPGAALVPHGRLAPLVRATPDEEVAISLTNGHLELSTADGACRLLTETGDLPVVEPLAEPSALMDQATMSWTLRRGVLAAAQERGKRYALDGIRLELPAEGPLTVISADSARLSRAQRAVDNPQDLEMEAILPSAGAQALIAIADASDEPIRFGLSESGNQFVAESDHVRMACALLEGGWPSWQEIIPDLEPTAYLEASHLLSIVQRARLMTTETTRAVSFQVEGGELVVEAESPDVGEGRLWMGLEDGDGAEAKIAFNPDFLVAVLGLYEDDMEVNLAITDRRDPAAIWPRHTEAWVYVVSPVVKEEG